MNEAHEKTRIRQLEDASAHWERKYANARQYNRNLEERIAALEARCRDLEERFVEAKGDSNRYMDVSYKRAQRIAELEAAIRWACGEIGEFPGVDPSKGRYYWRTELRQRANLPYSAPETQEEPHGMVTHSSINTKCEKCGEPLLHKNHMFDAQTALNRSVKP